MIERMMEQLKGVVPKWVLNRLQGGKRSTGVFFTEKF